MFDTVEGTIITTLIYIAITGILFYVIDKGE